MRISAADGGSKVDLRPRATVQKELWVFCRTDYQLATPGIAALARREQIFLDQRFSDHAPLIIDYDFSL